MKLKFSWEVLLVLIIWIFYAYLSLSSPIGDNQFELSESSIYWIRLTIIIPYLLVWLAAGFGATRLASYAEKLGNNLDGKAMASFAKGLYALLAGMILATVLSTIRTRWPEQTDFINRSTQVILNYIYVLFPLIGYVFMFQATRKLAQLVPTIESKSRYLFNILLFIGAVSSIYILGIFSNNERQFAESGNASFYISDLAIVLTIIIPTIASWTIGSIVAARVWHFQKEVQGLFYKRSLKWLSSGMMSVVVASVILQLLISLGSSRLLGLGLELILLVIYVWLIALAIGYLLVAYGAKRLSIIEEA